MTRVSASLVLMMTPPCTVAFDDNSLISGCRSKEMVLSELTCGVTRIEIPIVVNCVIAFPASSATINGTSLRTNQDLRFTIVHRCDGRIRNDVRFLGRSQGIDHHVELSPGLYRAESHATDGTCGRGTDPRQIPGHRCP